MNSSVKLRKKNGVNILVLEHARANTLDDKLIRMLSEYLRQLEDTEPVLMTGNGDFFSAGLDLHYCERLDKTEFENFIENFQHLLLSLFNRAGFTTALLNGHAVAGGFLLAACADLVMMRPGTYAVGLNEARLGFSLPAVPLSILKHTYVSCFELISGRHEFYRPEQIAAFSPFEICVADLGTICKKIKNIAAGETWRKLKKIRQEAVYADLEKNKAEIMKRFYTEWWSEKAVSARGDITAGFVRRKQAAKAD